MTGSLLVLERFDACRPAAAGANIAVDATGCDQRLRAEVFAEGYAAGQAASAEQTGEQTQFLKTVSEAIALQNAAAPQKLAQQAGAALKTILERIFPTLANTGFVTEAAAAFAAAAQNAEGRTLEISAPPDKTAALEALLKAHMPNAAVSIRADATLDNAVARATWTGGGIEFDLDRATRECLAAFETAVNQLGSSTKL